MFGAFEVKVAEIVLPEHVRSRAGHLWVTTRASVHNNGETEPATTANSPVAAPPGGTNTTTGSNALPPLGIRGSTPTAMNGSGRRSTSPSLSSAGANVPIAKRSKTIPLKSTATTSKHSADGSSFHDWALAEDDALWVSYVAIPDQAEYPVVGEKLELELWFEPTEAVTKKKEGTDGSGDCGSSDDDQQDLRTSTYAGITHKEAPAAKGKDDKKVVKSNAELLATTSVDGLALATLPSAKVESLGQQSGSALIEGYPRFASVTSVIVQGGGTTTSAENVEEEAAAAPASGEDASYFRALVRYIPLDFLVDSRDGFDGRQFTSRCQCFPYGAMPLDCYAEFAALGSTLLSRAEDLPGEKGSGLNAAEDEQQETGTILSRRSRGAGSARDLAARKKLEAGPPKAVRLSKKLIHGRLGQFPHRFRWELLTELNLSCEIIGDSGLPVILSVANQCRGLLSLNVDRNSLTLVSAKRLMSELRSHPSLERLSAGHNSFYESAGEEILRLLRVNRKIQSCSLEGNSLSPYLLKRFAKQLDINRMEKDTDPFNALGSNYNYLSASVESLPPEVWGEVKKIWTILSVGSVPENLDDHLDTVDGQSMVVSSHPNAGGRVGGISSRSMTREKQAAGGDAQEQEGPEGIAGASSLDATIPMLATTALFREVMQSVQRAFSETYEDPDIRRLFSEASNAMIRIQPLPTIVMGNIGEEPECAVVGGNAVDVHDGTPAPASVAQRSAATRSRGGMRPGSKSASFRPRSTAGGGTTTYQSAGGTLSDDPAEAEEFEEDQEYRGTFFPQCFTKLIFLPLRVASEYPHRWSDCVKILRALGKTHRQLGVYPHHYEAAAKATLQALTNHLGPSIMGEGSTRAAWVQFFSLVQRIVLSGTGDVM